MIDRRSLLSHAGSVAALFSESAKQANAAIQLPFLFETRSSLYGFVVAYRRACLCRSRSQIDFWTARMSAFDHSLLPQHIDRAVVWDDLFPTGEVSKTFAEIINQHLPVWHDIDSRDDGNRIAVHLEDCNTIGEVFQDLMPVARKEIALVDLTSVGVGHLSWANIIPHLHASYRLVVGIEYEPDASEIGLNFLSDPTSCDLAFLFTDRTLGFERATLFEERRYFVDAVLHRLIGSLEECAHEEITAKFAPAAAQDCWIRLSPLNEGDA